MSDSTAEVRLRTLISLADRLDAANEEYPSLEAFVWNHSPRDEVHADTPLYPNLLPPYSYFRYRNTDLQPLRWNHPRQSSDVLLCSEGTSRAWVIVGDSPDDDLAASHQHTTLIRHAEAVAKFLPETGDPCGAVLSILAQDERFQALGRHPSLPCWVYRRDGRVEWEDASEARRLRLIAPRDFLPPFWCAYIPRVFAAMADYVRELASAGRNAVRTGQSGGTERAQQVVGPIELHQYATHLTDLAFWAECPSDGSTPPDGWEQSVRSETNRFVGLAERLSGIAPPGEDPAELAVFIRRAHSTALSLITCLTNPDRWGVRYTGWDSPADRQLVEDVRAAARRLRLAADSQWTEAERAYANRAPLVSPPLTPDFPVNGGDAGVPPAVQTDGQGVAAVVELLPSLLSAGDIAKLIGKNRKSVTTFLTRFADSNRHCRVEVENPQANSPRYLYRTGDVWPAIQSWLSAGATG